ncbi:hypothetical protein LV564_07765 [Komagataeibacter nataicola]|uniref:hypothetical protein n=1 Tax=Komagataeibacter nataicola TaxID=265960 RepID=UPI0011B85972|nr:hypothetical protein [Komagataeibacter nataicola]WEQ56944.1 hypothetical protein LV564_07765 [Komagataeibacter nataicola]
MKNTNYWASARKLHIHVPHRMAFTGLVFCGAPDHPVMRMVVCGKAFFTKAVRHAALKKQTMCENFLYNKLVLNSFLSGAQTG